MLSAAFLKSLRQMGDAKFKRTLFIGVGAAALVQILLGILLWKSVGQIKLLDWDWANTIVGFLGGFAAHALLILTFPAISTTVMSIWLDDVAMAVEDVHYPQLPAPRQQALAGQVTAGARFAFVTIGLNLMVLPLYLIPGLNLIIYYLLNGYLFGREYAELVLLRRLDNQETKAMRQANRGLFFFAGALIAFLFSIPLLNLAAPVLGTAIMTHVAESLRRRRQAV
jgi:CysZ protein